MFVLKSFGKIAIVAVILWGAQGQAEPSLNEIVSEKAMTAYSEIAQTIFEKCPPNRGYGR